MRPRLAVLFVTMAVCAFAQRGGGTPAGHGGGGGGGPNWGHPSPIQPPSPGFGKNRWWRGSRRPGSGPFVGYWPGAAAFDTPLCASPLFPLAPNCYFGDMGSEPYYPPPQDYAPPPTNVIVVPAPLPPPVPVPVENTPAEAAVHSPQTIPAANTCETSHRPIAAAEHDDYPPVLVLKTGGMYSIQKYWTKNRTIYFQTTAGDTLYAPLASLERILPGSKPGK